VQTATGEQMQVDMEHRLTGFAIGVEHGPIAST
jgi:hypothetical protein